MKLKPIRNTSKTVFALAFASIFGLNVYMVIHLHALIENNRLLNKTLMIQGLLNELLALVTDVETAPRGYVIMGDERFLKPYYEAVLSKNGVGWHLQELRRLTIDPEQQELLGALEPLVIEKMAFMKKVIELRRRAGFYGVQKWIATDIGRKTMEDIRRVVGKMKKREEVLLQQRSEFTEISLLRLILTMSAGIGSALSLLLFSFLVIVREVKKRKSAEEMLQLLNSDLEERVKERTAELQAELELRKQNELKISNLSRVYATLSQVNQTILHVKERDKLFQDICRVVVEYGQFGLAWIGVFDHETALVTPKAVYGEKRTLLPSTVINIEEESFKNGIIASAVESGKVVFSKNIQTDPAMQHWGEMALAGGFHAAASVPIRLNGVIVALLNI